MKNEDDLPYFVPQAFIAQSEKNTRIEPLMNSEVLMDTIWRVRFFGYYMSPACTSWGLEWREKVTSKRTSWMTSSFSGGKQYV